jgi:thiosulfate/3-mercaptopyruvate sulfurtransferase
MGASPPAAGDPPAATCPDPAASVLVDARSLAASLAGEDPPVLLDVRWRLGDDTGPARYANGHLPGAVYVDLDRELGAPPSAQ